MTFTETIALIDALNDKLRGIAEQVLELIPNDWGHIFLLARALDIEIPGEPVVTPRLKDPSAIALMEQKLQVALTGQAGEARAFNEGQAEALRWVLGSRHEPNR